MMYTIISDKSQHSSRTITQPDTLQDVQNGPTAINGQCASCTLLKWNYLDMPKKPFYAHLRRRQALGGASGAALGLGPYRNDTTAQQRKI